MSAPLEMEKRDDVVVVDDPEKTPDVSEAASLDLDGKDEALRLVGLERTEIFTEEQYRKVRWKLVSRTRCLSFLSEINCFASPPGLGYCAAVSSSLLLTVPVRPPLLIELRCDRLGAGTRTS